MRPIDADALIQTIVNTATNANRKAYETGAHTFTEALDRLAELTKEIVGMINEAPTLNPDDCRPHGRWMTYDGEATCSLCKFTTFGWAEWAFDYCPNCGAKMDGKENNA
ncbi:MAG: hypothetical protein J6R01_08270 [Alistipes sp.]|nr:hypothetical protein [Alistipes sp.]